jgi:hypothetical protein
VNVRSRATLRPASAPADFDHSGRPYVRCPARIEWPPELPAVIDTLKKLGRQIRPTLLRSLEGKPFTPDVSFELAPPDDDGDDAR